MAFGPGIKVKLFLPLLAILMSMTALLVSVQSVAASHIKPKSLKFYMYVAVQNNTDLNKQNASYTAVQSAQPLLPQSNAFGIIHTFDNPITKKAELKSTQVGRVQGWYGDVGQRVLTLLLVQTFTYSHGKYNGTFSLLGVDVATDARKLAPIVGGTGDFAYVRGVAEQCLVSMHVVNGETVSWFHYTITFKH